MSGERTVIGRCSVPAGYSEEPDRLPRLDVLARFLELVARQI